MVLVPLLVIIKGDVRLVHEPTIWRSDPFDLFLLSEPAPLSADVFIELELFITFDFIADFIADLPPFATMIEPTLAPREDRYAQTC